MFKTKKIRNLHESFRDGLIKDFIVHQRSKVNLFDLVPKQSTGRLHTLAVMRKMASKMAKEFPGGIIHDAPVVMMTPEFLAFANTCDEEGLSIEEAMQAWQALRGIVRDGKH